jgi:ubiquinone/menaquinone biosynthesis C-methylase UbiE
MTQPSYEYHGLMAKLWDTLRGDTSQWEDRFFYLEAVRRYGQPVLDVGCGTGRILVDFRQQGIDIDGVDNSPEMLALCREKLQKQNLTATLYQQTMEGLDIPRQYQTILVPSSSFQLLLDPATAKQAMRKFFQHLVPGGRLVMPFMILWQPGQPLDEAWEKTMTRAEDGAIAWRKSRSWYDLEQKLEHTEDHYKLTLNGEVIAEEVHTQSPATRWYSVEEIQALFEGAGFTALQWWRYLPTWEPKQATDTTFFVVGQKPS